MLVKYIKLLLLLIIVIIMIEGCACRQPKPEVITKVVTKIKIKKVYIPKELLVIKPIPKVPNNIKLQSQVARYVLDLYESAKTCKDDKKLIIEYLSK